MASRRLDNVPGLYEIILEGTYAQAATGYV